MTENEFATRSEQIKTKLYRMAYLYLDSENMAVDAVDEAVYNGLRGFKKLRQPEFFDTWMMRILINECKKALRRTKREQPLDSIPEAAAEEFDKLPLKEALRRLPNELREVISLRYFVGLTLLETAESLGIPQGTVVTRQRRALHLLKLELSEEESA